jgi:hypothetical protein
MTAWRTVAGRTLTCGDSERSVHGQQPMNVAHSSGAWTRFTHPSRDYGTACVGALTVCAASSAACSVHQAASPEMRGHLQVRLGPGSPVVSDPSNIRLRVTSPSSMTVHARVGEQVSLLLPEGVYSVRSADGSVCATGISVVAGAIISDDLPIR